MTTAQAKKEFEKMIAKMKVAGVDPDKIAEIEVVKEYFTNPEFRAKLSEFVYNINQ